MTEPYRSPAAAPVDGDATGRASTDVFAFRGRLGRLRYFAYVGLVMLVLYLLLTFASVLTAGAAGSEPSALVGVVALLLMAVATFAATVYGVRRLNDLNRSGWLILLGFVPLVNVLLALFLLFAPGTPGDNRYGPRPPPNGTGVILGAVAAALVMLAMIAILAAVALPAYQDYVKRAEAYQMRMDGR